MGNPAAEYNVTTAIDFKGAPSAPFTWTSKFKTKLGLTNVPCPSLAPIDASGPCAKLQAGRASKLAARMIRNGDLACLSTLAFMYAPILRERREWHGSVTVRLISSAYAKLSFAYNFVRVNLWSLLNSGMCSKKKGRLRV